VQPLFQWKSKNITYSACVFVALGVQHAMRLRHIVICGLSGCAVFFNIISQTARYSKEKNKLLNMTRGSVQLLSKNSF